LAFVVRVDAAIAVAAAVPPFHPHRRRFPPPPKLSKPDPRAQAEATRFEKGASYDATERSQPISVRARLCPAWRVHLGRAAGGHLLIVVLISFLLPTITSTRGEGSKPQ
jgi:hypothetical protein